MLEWPAFITAAASVYLYGQSKRQGAMCGILASILFMAWGVTEELWGAATINVGFLLLNANNLRGED